MRLLVLSVNNEVSISWHRQLNVSNRMTAVSSMGNNLDNLSDNYCYSGVVLYYFISRYYILTRTIFFLFESDIQSCYCKLNCIRHTCWYQNNKTLVLGSALLSLSICCDHELTRKLMVSLNNIYFGLCHKNYKYIFVGWLVKLG